jgi:hypothetical protein
MREQEHLVPYWLIPFAPFKIPQLQDVCIAVTSQQLNRMID